MGFGSSKDKKPDAPPTVNELKATLEVCKQKYKLERNKKIDDIKKKKDEIINCLKNNNKDMAMAKMENLILAENYITVYDKLEQFTQILIEKCIYIVSNNECPTDLRPYLDTVIYAANRLEMKELKEFRDKIKIKYGEAYITKAENNVDRFIDQTLYEKINTTIFENSFKNIRLKQLCQEKNINYISQEEIPSGEWERTNTNINRNPYESMRPELPTQSFVQKNSSTNNETGLYPNISQLGYKDGFPGRSQNQFQPPVYPNQPQQPGYPNQSQQPGYPNQSQLQVYPNPDYPPNQSQNQNTKSNNPSYENQVNQNPSFSNNNNNNNSNYSFRPQLNNTSNNSMKNSTQNQTGNGSVIPPTLINDTIPVQDNPQINVDNILDNEKTTMTQLTNNQSKQGNGSITNMLSGTNPLLDPKISQGSKSIDYPPNTSGNFLDNVKTTLTKLSNNQNNPQSNEVDAFGGKTSETIHVSAMSAQNVQPNNGDVFGGITSDTIHISAQNPQQPNEEEIFGGPTSQTVHLSQNNTINNNIPKGSIDYFGGNTGQTMHASVANPDNKENPFDGGDPLDVPTIPIQQIGQMKIQGSSNNPFAEGVNPFDAGANLSDPFGVKTILDEEDSIKKSGK